MVKTLQKSSSLEADFHETWYVASGLLPIIVCSNDDPEVTLTYFTLRSNFVTNAFLEKKVDFSKTIAACDLKLIEQNLMEICEY